MSDFKLPAFAARALPRFCHMQLSQNLYLRKVFNLAQPFSSLKSEDSAPFIELLIVVAEKDLGTLKLAIDAAKGNSKNPISRVTLICPEHSVKRLKLQFPECNTLSERLVLGDSLSDAIRSHHSPGRLGWFIQQVAGLAYCRQSTSAGVLWVDADTVLLRPKLFLTSKGVQALSVSHEYVNQYETHAEKIWGPRLKMKGLSFVTHFQLMQPDVVREMFPTKAALRDWVLGADISFNSPLSEYHSYGRFICEKNPRRVRLEKWDNRAVTISEEQLGNTTIDQLAATNPKLGSISFHTYLRK